MEQALLDLSKIEKAKPYLDPDRGYHVQRLCEDLAVRRSDFAKATKRTNQAVHRYFGEKADFVAIQTGVVLRTFQSLLSIRLLLADLVDDDEKARLWMRIPNRAFGNQSPLDLVRNGRAREVIEALESLVRGDHPR